MLQDSSSMLYDTHCHINFSAFKEDGHEVIKRTLGKNVWMNLVGSQISTSRRTIQYAEKYPEGVYAVIGLHPIHLAELAVDPAEIGGGAPGFTTRKEEFSYEAYKELAIHPKVVAIGECGLDYYHSPDNTPDFSEIIKLQKKVFIRQIDLAQEVGKPLMVHCRSHATPEGKETAHEDALTIFESYPFKQEPALRGQINFFSGALEQAKRYIRLGFLISFTGVITFARDRDEIIRALPLEYICIETDAPYVAPEPYRGKRNEPLYVEYIARTIAEIKCISFEKVARQTTENARRLYRV